MTTKTERKTINTDSYVALLAVKSIIAPPQKEVRKTDIDTLSASIKAIGLINPITVVQDKNKRYRILAGRRRYWACVLAELIEISCTVIQTDDTAANRIIEVAENLHRLQLTPMQEANAIQKLRNLKMTDESIAADMGMTQQFVVRRAKLLDLSPTWQKALLGKPVKGQFGYPTETLVQHWPIACLELIARYEHKRQDDLITLTNDIPNINDLKKILSSFEHKLIGVPWSLDDESLYPKAGSCANCPKRSSVQPLLFDDGVTSKKKTVGDKCLDDNCFQEKMRRHTDIKLLAAKTKHPDAILISSNVNYTNERGKNGLAQQDYELVTKKTKGAKAALYVDGKQAGKIAYIKLPEHVKAKMADAKKKPITDKDRAQRLRNRRNKWIIDFIRDELTKKKFESAELSLQDVAAAVSVCGLSIDDYKDFVETKNIFSTFSRRLNMSNKELCALFWKNFRHNIARQLSCINTGILASEIMPTLDPLFWMMGTDEVNLRKQRNRFRTNIII